MGRATIKKIQKPKKQAFQSTPSVGRATCWNEPMEAADDISIHALRGEGDIIGRFIAGKK